MTLIFDIILPVFGIALIGYLASWKGWFSESAENGVGNFIFNFACPFMLFGIMSRIHLPEHPPLPFLASFYLPLAFVGLLGFLLSRFVFGRSYPVQVITSFCGCYGNTTLLGLPLLLVTFGEEKILPYYILLSVHGLSLFTVITILLEFGKQKEQDAPLQNRFIELGKSIFLSMIKNPILMSIFLGLVVNFAGLDLPRAVYALTDMMKQAVVPSALFILGAGLTRYGLRGRLGESISVVILKLLLFPSLVYLAGSYIFHIDPFWTMVAVIAAAQPPSIMTYIFANKYQSGQAITSTSNVISSVFCMFTITAILYLLDVR